MDTKQIIKALGGHAAVVEATGLSKGRISQWSTQNRIPRAWLQFFRASRSDIAWDDYCPTTSMKADT